MKIKRNIFFPITVLLVCMNTSCHLLGQDSREKGWISDIDTLLVKMKTEHYIYRNYPLPNALITGAENLKKNVSEFSDERILIELQRLMFWLGDGHCYVLPFGAKRVP